MKEILCQINKGDYNASWFRMLYAQLQNDYKITVIEAEEEKSPIRKLFIDLSIRLESLYKLAGEIPNDNHSIEIGEASNSGYEFAINLSSSDCTCPTPPIIEFYYRGQRLFSCPYIGIIEHLEKEATIDLDVFLFQGKKEILVEQAKYRGHWSVLKNQALLYYSLPSLIRKTINKVVQEKYYQQTYTTHLLNSEINLRTSFRYFISSIHNINTKLFNTLGNKFFHTSGGQEWTVFIGKGSFLDSKTTQLKPTILPQGEFWADPFLFIYKDNLWLFFERFPYKTNKGVISCTRIVEGKPTEVWDVLDKPYHLSYPNVFEEEGEIFMIPECSAAKRLEVYRCTDFPSKWELYSTAFEGESFADSVFFKDDNGDRWLFSSKESPVVVSHCNELWAYKIDSLKFNSIEPHKQNPIVINAGVARNGGTIYRENNKIYRASQDNSFEMYGKGICINEITELSLDSYSEKIVRRIDAKDVPGIIGMHHMDQIDGFFVIDGRLK